MKKATSVLLAVIMLLSAMPLTIIGSAGETSYAVGDIIEYGSYPQTKVTNTTIKSQLNTLAGSTSNWTSYNYYSSKNTVGNYMKYKDVTYNGEKYRGVYFSSYRNRFTTSSVSTSTSTSYTYQYTNGYICGNTYWFKYEPIQWVIFEAGTGGLAVCKNVIDSQAYCDTYYSYNSSYYGDSSHGYYCNNWEHSTIRTWLNSTFINTAFTSSQQSNIVKTTIKTPAYSTSYSKYDSADTSDKVFLLSWTDVQNTAYGFASGTSSSSTRKKTGTDYAKSQGLSVNSSNGCSTWRLRSAGDDSCITRGVSSLGGVSYDDTNCASDGVVAALYFQSYNPRIYEVGDTIEYGSYPQTKVTNTTIKSQLNTIAGSTDNWTSYNYYSSKNTVGNYMKYKDVTYNGEKYRGVYFSSYRNRYTTSSVSTSTSTSYTYQYTNGYTCGYTYWFKYEPIEWVILEAGTGGLAVCKNVIDSQAYCDTYYSYNSSYYGDSSHGYYCNNWEHSTIRTWLNSTFINTAFTSSQQSNIVKTTIKTPAYSTSYSKYDSADTSDKVFLLSWTDVQNTAYGFASGTSSSTTRQKTGTDYAKSQGLYVNSSNGCSYWRLRSAGYDSYGTCIVHINGYVSYSYTHYTFYGVVAALYFQSYNPDTLGICATHSYQSVVATPTCTEQGYTTHTCTKCRESYIDTYTTALGHDYSSKTTTSIYQKSAATCTSAAVYYYKCSRCSAKGTSTYTYGSSLGHNYSSKDTSSIYLKSAATCISAAVYYYKCSICAASGSSTYTYGYSLGHDYSSKTTTSAYLKSAATCTSAAVYYYKCSRCTASGSSTYTYGYSLGHDYSSKTTTSTYLKSAATCTSAAVYYYKCSRCTASGSSTYTYGYSLGHDYSSKTMTSTYRKSAATCTSAAVYYYKCSRCSAKGTSTYAYGSSLGHKYKTSITRATFSRDGSSVTKCSRCSSTRSYYTIYRIGTVSLSKTTYTCTGKAIKPTVTVRDIYGYTISSSNYSLSYSNNVNPTYKGSTAKVKITFKGNYSGTKTLSFNIKLGQVKITSYSMSSSYKVSMKWKSIPCATKYQVYYYNTSEKTFKSDGTVSKPSFTQTWNGWPQVKFKVRAVYMKGSKVVADGPWSSAVTVKHK